MQTHFHSDYIFHSVTAADIYFQNETIVFVIKAFTFFSKNERNHIFWWHLDHLRSFRLRRYAPKTLIMTRTFEWVAWASFLLHAEPAGPHGHSDGGKQSYPAWEHSSGEPCGGADVPATLEKSERLCAAERPGAAGLPATGRPTLLLRHLPLHQTWSLLKSAYNNTFCKNKQSRSIWRAMITKGIRKLKLSWVKLLCCADQLPRDVLMMVTTQLLIFHHMFLISRHHWEKREMRWLIVSTSFWRSADISF